MNKEDLKQAIIQARREPDRFFCEKILRSPNDPWQAELLEAAADVWRVAYGERTRANHRGLRMISVRSPHGPGKTHWLAKLMHLFNFCFPGRIVATAPKQNQLKTRLWPEFRKLRAGAIAEYRELTNVKAESITWANSADWAALAETGASPENLQGHHWEHLLIVVDEASGIKEEMFPVIEAALATGEVVILAMIGNPTRTSGSFWASHCKRNIAKLYYRKHVRIEDTAGERRRQLQEYAKLLRTKYGERSPVYQVRALGEFAETEEDQIIALEWLQAAADREFALDGSLPRLRTALDVADGGLAESAVFTGRKYESVDHWLRLTRHSFPSARAPILSAREAERQFTEYGGRKAEDDLVVDGVGVGAGSAGALILDGYNVVRFMGGAASENKRYRDRRTAATLAMRNALRDGRVAIDEAFTEDEQDWDDFCAQMCALRTRPGRERVEEVLSKRELIEKGYLEASPDLADAAIMWYALESAEPTILLPDDFGVVGRLESADYEGIAA